MKSAVLWAIDVLQDYAMVKMFCTSLHRLSIFGISGLGKIINFTTIVLFYAKIKLSKSISKSDASLAVAEENGTA